MVDQELTEHGKRATRWARRMSEYDRLSECTKDSLFTQAGELRKVHALDAGMSKLDLVTCILDVTHPV